MLTWAVKHLLADTVAVQNKTSVYNEVFFNYDFDDVFGADDIRKMFITKLMGKGTGNCHSFPYLYKILADELGVGKDVHLAYAPNHVFIRMKLGDNWWNLELTSGYFLQDWYMMATGYIHTQGIQGGIYLTPVTEKESIAACLMDLATYYESKYGLDNFVYKCAMLAQECYPNCLQAMMYKANYWNLAISYKMNKYGIEDIEVARKHPEIGPDIESIEATIAEIDAKGYVPVPEELYQEWLESMEQEKERRAGFK